MPSIPVPDTPLTDKVNIVVHRFEDLSSDRMQLKTELTLHQEWSDDRLTFSSSGGQINSLSMTDTTGIWIPDIFFVNSRTGHHPDLMRNNVLIWISPSGRVSFSTRISLTTSCTLDLSYFPHDHQVCRISIASYGHTADDMILAWGDSLPVQVEEALLVQEFDFIGLRVDPAVPIASPGNFSLIWVSFEFERQFSHYWRSVYVPCLFLVSLSYLSLWVKQQDHQFILSLAAPIALASTMTIASASFPQVSYTRSADVWIAVCLTFTVISFLIPILMRRLPEKQSIKSPGNDIPLICKALEKHADTTRRTLAHRITRQRVDLVIKITYPLLFVICLLTYWITQGRRSRILP